jgi:hypothetical protein
MIADPCAERPEIFALSAPTRRHDAPAHRCRGERRGDCAAICARVGDMSVAIKHCAFGIVASTPQIRKIDGNKWAGNGLSASVRGSMNCCRLGRSKRWAVDANKAAFRCSDQLTQYWPFVQPFKSARQSVGRLDASKRRRDLARASLAYAA